MSGNWFLNAISTPFVKFEVFASVATQDISELAIEVCWKIQTRSLWSTFLHKTFLSLRCFFYKSTEANRLRFLHKNSTFHCKCSTWPNAFIETFRIIDTSSRIKRGKNVSWMSQARKWFHQLIYRRRFLQCRSCLQHREKCYIMNIKIPVQPLSQRYSRLETNKQPLPDVNCCSPLQDLNAAIMILKSVERINGIAKWRRRRDYLNAHDVNRFED